MKKKLFYLLALSVSFGLVVSCNKTTEEMEVQETPDLETIISENLAGTYSGELTISLTDGQETSPISQEVNVEKGEGESITLSVTNFSYDTLELGDIVLENCEVTDNEDGTYSFTGETTLTLTALGDGMSAEVSGTGTITLGDTVTLSLSLDIIVYWSGYQVMQVTVTYEGTKE